MHQIKIGSPSSRALTEDTARKSAAVLVLEPGTGINGKLKTARKGVGDYKITVRGLAAHAGVDFSNGASAILEMSRQIGGHDRRHADGKGFDGRDVAARVRPVWRLDSARGP